MDHYQNQRSQMNNNMTNSQDASTPQPYSPSENPNRSVSDRQNQPQRYDGFSMIPPNQSRRNNLVMMAKKEEEDLDRYKETHRAGPVYMNPEKLGGDVTLAEARQKQFTEQRCSKSQKKWKREEQEKRRKEEEEAELQKKKYIARQKAERLEQMKQQEEEQRREEFESDHLRVNNSFLQQFETMASLSRSATSPVNQQVHDTTNMVKKNLEELQQDHERVNSAFLDRLERQGQAVSSSSSSEILQAAPEKQSSSHLHSHPVPMSGDGPKCHQRQCETRIGAKTHIPACIDSRPDFEWSLMKLMSNFPELERDIVEDFLNQCNGNYQQAYELLSPY